ncbi:uridine kinase-like protein [Artemisia annua]|uniref:Uridine kinase n=1 Tax=Artemisia annua TaxID=35608 RepID=A0A2U1PA37_ARTAN|nr:uridine kinase-like protein [Artemisia annua]
MSELGISEVVLYDAKLTIRAQIAIASDIRTKLINTPRYALFRETCFGPWLDVQLTYKNPSLVHLILQTEYIPEQPKNDEILFRVGGHELRFGREEFCLITGFRFGTIKPSSEGSCHIPFRDRVFSHIPGKISIKGSDVASIFKDSFDQISDLDAVRICLLLLLEIGFIGRQPNFVIDEELLRLVEDLDSWNTFPWGSYIWNVTYPQLAGALQTRRGLHLSNLATKEAKYTLVGFIWAFKIWILEVFPAARKFAVRDPGVIPRAIAWRSTCTIKKEMLHNFLVFKEGLEPLHELIPTLAESSTPWWMASRRFFDGIVDDFQPPLKKLRFTAPPSPLEPHSQHAMVLYPNHAERSRSGTTASHHTMEERIMEKVVKMIDHPVSRKEELVEELSKDRRSPEVHTEMPKMSDFVDEMASEPILRLKERVKVESRVLHSLPDFSDRVYCASDGVEGNRTGTRNTNVEQASTSVTGKSHKQPFVIGVAGGAASGKTVVCNLIIEQLHDLRVVLVKQESFYHNLTSKELSEFHEYNFDHPDAFNTEKVLTAMEMLKYGKAIDIPEYDFKSHKTGVPRRVNPSDVVILEGILILYDPRVRDMMDMKIFVDTDADVRLERRIRRDTGERGRDISLVLGQYSKFVKPAFDAFILPTKKYADIIIPHEGDNHLTIDLIGQHVQTKLGQHDLCKIYPNLYVIQSTFQIRAMHTLIRDFQTTQDDFTFHADRLIRMVVEHGLGHLPFTEKQVTTPTGSVYTGVDFDKSLCGVSVIRSGESMETALRACCKGIKIGKILIHKEGENGHQVIYERLPQDISDRHVLLLDPILGTGYSAVEAINLLLKRGVPEGNIIFLNLISAPQGVHVVCKRFPRIKIVTSEIETGLNQESRVIPGMGEFGDRYFGTEF